MDYMLLLSVATTTAVIDSGYDKGIYEYSWIFVRRDNEKKLSEQDDGMMEGEERKAGTILKVLMTRWWELLNWAHMDSETGVRLTLDR